MIGTKIKKPVITQAQCDHYASIAKWCNENDAHLEDRDSFYEVVANEHPEPTYEEKAEAIRSERNRLLDESDRWALVDNYEKLTAEQKAELKDYRQALRDVTEQETFPESVVYPTKPVWMNPKNDEVENG